MPPTSNLSAVDAAVPVAEASGPVLFFDGQCGLCHRLVRFLLRLDRAGRLHFAPLQGKTAQGYLRVQGLATADFDTLIFVPAGSGRSGGQHLVRTAGVIAALRAVGGGTARMLAAGLALFPASIRDAGYRVVGRWRYRIFGPWVPRPLADPRWATRFLE